MPKGSWYKAHCDSIDRHNNMRVVICMQYWVLVIELAERELEREKDNV